MYSSVYYHHTGRAASNYFSRIVKLYCKKKKTNPLFLCKLDDESLSHILLSEASSNPDIINIQNRVLPKISQQLRPENITKYPNFTSFIAEQSFESICDIESKIHKDCILDIPKYEEYEEIHIWIKDKDNIDSITNFSNVVKGLSQNKDYLWIGYIFTKGANRGDVIPLARKYFADHDVGLAF